MCPHLGNAFYMSCSHQFIHNFLKVWGTPEGASLVRMSDILPTITDRTQENIMLEHVRKSHVEKRQPCIMDLSKECPSPKEIQSSYLKLRDLFIPDSIRTFKIQDFKFYGLLDSTKWLLYVSVCLSKACEAAKEMCSNNAITVVLQEGRSFTNIISPITVCVYRKWTGYELCNIKFNSAIS